MMFEDFGRRDEMPGSKLVLELEAITQVSSWMEETVFIVNETDYVSATEKMFELGVHIEVVDGVYPGYSGPDLRRVIEAFNGQAQYDEPIVAVYEGVVMISSNVEPVSTFCERMREDLRRRSMTDDERAAESRARFDRALAAARVLDKDSIADFVPDCWRVPWTTELDKPIDSILGFADNG